jgi:hypothetical protein
MGRALEAVIPLGQRKAEGGDKSVLIVPITKALAPGALRGVGRHPSTQGDFGFVVKP